VDEQHVGVRAVPLLAATEAPHADDETGEGRGTGAGLEVTHAQLEGHLEQRR
jgi:hypothetical protein